MIRAPPSVSLCFPVYNEESTVSYVIEEAHALATRAGLNFEILACDDGSSDHTSVVLDELARRLPSVRIIRHLTNQGIRATFEELYTEATKDFIFLNSTDRQWETKILLDMLPLMAEWDVVIASRRNKPYTPIRRLVSWGFNAVPVLLFGVQTIDAGAVKLQRREIIDRFDLVSRSPFTEAERLIRASRAGYRYTFFPIEGTRRQFGREHGASWRLVSEALLDVVRVWWAVRVVDQPAPSSAERASDIPVSS